MKVHKRPYIVLLIIIIIFIALYYLGAFFGKQCSLVTVEGCPDACWNIMTTKMVSELCPTEEPCTVEPYKMQHNAIVDLLTCACDKAGENNFKNTELNSKIVDVFNAWKGQSLPAEDICTSGLLVKLRY